MVIDQTITSFVDLLSKFSLFPPNPTIFEKGIFLICYPTIKNKRATKGECLRKLNCFIKQASPSQRCTQEREREREREREQGSREGRVMKQALQFSAIYYVPPKLRMQDVTFHLCWHQSESDLGRSNTWPPICQVVNVYNHVFF